MLLLEGRGFPLGCWFGRSRDEARPSRLARALEVGYRGPERLACPVFQWVKRRLFLSPVLVFDEISHVLRSLLGDFEHVGNQVALLRSDLLRQCLKLGLHAVAKAREGVLQHLFQGAELDLVGEVVNAHTL